MRFIGLMLASVGTAILLCVLPTSTAFASADVNLAKKNKICIDTPFGCKKEVTTFCDTYDLCIRCDKDYKDEICDKCPEEQTGAWCRPLAAVSCGTVEFRNCYFESDVCWGTWSSSSFPCKDLGIESNQCETVGKCKEGL
jgi:hypothetical protein